RRSACRQYGQRLGLAHGRAGGEVVGRPVKVERHHLEVEPGRAGERIDGSTAALEVLDHATGQLWRKRADAIARNAMIAGKDDGLAPVQFGVRRALPARYQQGDVFQPPERAFRLAQVPLVRTSALPSRRIQFRKRGQRGVKRSAIRKQGHSATNPAGGMRVMKWPLTPSGQSL